MREGVVMKSLNRVCVFLICLSFIRPALSGSDNSGYYLGADVNITEHSLYKLFPPKNGVYSSGCISQVHSGGSKGNDAYILITEKGSETIYVFDVVEDSTADILVVPNYAVFKRTDDQLVTVSVGTGGLGNEYEFKTYAAFLDKQKLKLSFDFKGLLSQKPEAICPVFKGLPIPDTKQ